jgi:hypothetical protein
VYNKSIIDHLVTVRVPHWDRAIRELAAKSLYNHATQSPDYIISQVLPKLMVDTLAVDVSRRHGSVHSIAEVLLALSRSIPNFSSILPEELRTSITKIVHNIEAQRLFRGKGGELVRSAVCRLIECVSLARLPLLYQEKLNQLEFYQKIIDENIRHPNSAIQLAAAAALAAFSATYYEYIPQHGKQKIVAFYISTIHKDPNAAARRGCCCTRCATTRLAAMFP